MTTAVLDTNVLASGIAGFTSAASPPGQLLHAWLSGRFQLVLSEAILGELARTLSKPYFSRRLTEAMRTEALTRFRRLAQLTPLTVTVSGVATHPEDDLMLATAVSASADYLVTGDHPLQRLGSYQGVTILSPRDFLQQLQP